LRTSIHTTPSQSTDSVHTLTFGGLQRVISFIFQSRLTIVIHYRLYLIFMEVRATRKARLSMSGFNTLADEKTFIVVYPNGSGLLGDKLLTWNAAAVAVIRINHNIDDVGFIRALLADIESSYKVDPSGVYANRFIQRRYFRIPPCLRCIRPIAAIGPVSGTLNISKCELSAPYRSFTFTAQPIEHVPYDGVWVISPSPVYPLRPSKIRSISG